MGLYIQQKSYSKKKPAPKNCDPIIAKVKFLITNYNDKLLLTEKQELLDILKTVERYHQYLSDEMRDFEHERLNALMQRYRIRTNN